MQRNSRKGGIIGVFLGGIVIVVSVLVLGAIAIVASSVRSEHKQSQASSRVHMETPFGDLNIDARKTLKPESLGIPVYPGASHEKNDDGGVLFDFDPKHGDEKQLSVVIAQYSTADSAEQVRAFYRDHLPNWLVTQRDDRGLKLELAKDGYRRIVFVEDRHGRTHIGIVSLGDEPAVN